MSRTRKATFGERIGAVAVCLILALFLPLAFVAAAVAFLCGAPIRLTESDGAEADPDEDAE